MVAHSLAGAGAGGWSRRVKSVPSAAAAGARNGGGACLSMAVQRIVNALYWNVVLSTSNDNRARNSTRFLRKRKLAKIFFA